MSFGPLCFTHTRFLPPFSYDLKVIEERLNRRIMVVTMRIKDEYPELYCHLNEMYATLPVPENNVINTISLNAWLDDLKLVVRRYDDAHN